MSKKGDMDSLQINKGIGEKDGVVFFRGVDTPMHNMSWFFKYIFKKMKENMLNQIVFFPFKK